VLVPAGNRLTFGKVTPRGFRPSPPRGASSFFLFRRCFFLWLSSCMSCSNRHKARLPKLRTAPKHQISLYGYTLYYKIYFILFSIYLYFVFNLFILCMVFVCLFIFVHLLLHAKFLLSICFYFLLI